MKKLLTLLLCLSLVLSMAAVPVLAADTDVAEEAADTGIADTAADTDAELADTGAEADDLAPTSYNLLTEEEFQLKMAQVREKYPDGGIWQGVYYEDGMEKAWTCWGYGCQMIYEFFGGKFYAENMYTKYIDYSMDTLNAGDWVRIDGDSHTIFLIKITDKGVYYTDGNGDGANGIRWDVFLSYEELQNRFSYKIHLPGNDLLGAETIHTVAYNANGGSGSMDIQEVSPGGTFTTQQNGFTRSDYSFAGYTVKRSYDNKWYTTDAGWQSAADIYDNGYTYKIYPEGREYTLGTPWLGSRATSTSFTFYAQWLPDYTTVELMSNYSGYNYMLGSDLGSNYSDYIYSRDTDTYSVSVDKTQRVNNANSLKIVGSSAGSSGSDLVMMTSTNYGYGDGYSQAGLVGDDKEMTLRFMAKASVSGAAMYIRWGYSSVYEAVELTTEWKTYYVDVPKTRFYSCALHPFFDKAGTYYLNSLSLGDEFNTNIIPESGTIEAINETLPRGNRIGNMPTPVREGYTFEGWYTAAEGGEEITSSTHIEESRIRLYAHWSKDISYTPVKTAEYNGHTYELYDNTMGWEDAAEFCAQMGGHLVTISNASENALAYSMISDRQGYCWIGLFYDQYYDQKWEWVTGEDTFYDNWYNSSYGTNDSGEYYAMMYPMDFNAKSCSGTWDECVGSEYRRSYYGYHNSFFICEYDDAVVLGDADGDGYVSSADATCIQRYLAEIPMGSTEGTVFRGDVDENDILTVTDATWIQRYDADMYTPYNIGNTILR